MGSFDGHQENRSLSTVCLQRWGVSRIKKGEGRDVQADTSYISVAGFFLSVFLGNKHFLDNAVMNFVLDYDMLLLLL